MTASSSGDRDMISSQSFIAVTVTTPAGLAVAFL